MNSRIGRRTASEIPGLDLAEQNSWQNYLTATLRLYATLNRRLISAHQLPMADLRMLQALSESPAGRARMGDLAVALQLLPSPHDAASPSSGGSGSGATLRQPGGSPGGGRHHHGRGPADGRSSHDDVRTECAGRLPGLFVASPNWRHEGAMQPDRNATQTVRPWARTTLDAVVEHASVLGAR